MAGPDRESLLVQDVVRCYSEAKSKRGIWEKHWEDIAQLVLPYYETSFYTQGNTVPGQERGYQMFDSTANTALFRFAAAMESMLTPRNGKWHRIRVTDPNLMKLRNVQLWCDQVNDALFYHRYSPMANYQSQQHDGYIGIGAFGTSCLYIDELMDNRGRKGLRYRNINLGEVYFQENHQGIVDTVLRRFPMTIRQIAQRKAGTPDAWIDRLPEKFSGMLATKPEHVVWVIHRVTPRADFNPIRIDAKGMPFESVYVIEDTQTFLEEGGYRQLPYAVSRYITAPGEIYGRSPAMNVLPSIKVLNEEKKTMLEQGHRAVAPVLLAHDDGIMDGLSLKPGATNYGAVNADGRPLVHTLPIGNVQIGKEMMDDERAGINDAFLVSLFQIMVESPQMTATEVLERSREKGALLSPTMGRFQSESLGPMIEREYSILLRLGLLPPIPPELIEAKARFHVEYDAPLNRAMRAEEASGIQRSVQFAAEIAGQTQDPSALDWFNWDTIIPEMVDINGAPYRYVNDPDTVAAKRKARQQQQATEQITQALPGMAAMAKAAAPSGAQTPGG
ncbi:portal protein [Dyella kyungheensis]|uniref:portal protein n=1 Tax=Dyella kyungheensis TaxID=1242174 RepID=UPI003CED0D0B